MCNGQGLTKYNVSPQRHVCLLIAWAKPSAMLWLSMVFRPSKGGPAGAGGPSASNLSLTSYPIQDECQIARPKSHVNKVEQPYLLYYLPIAGIRIIGFIPFPRVSAQSECKLPRPGFELASQCSFLKMITIAPRRPPKIYIVTSFKNWPWFWFWC